MFIKVNKVAGKRISKGSLRTESKSTEYEEIIKEEIINSSFIKRIWPKERYTDYSYITLSDQSKRVSEDKDITVKNNFYDLCRMLDVKWKKIGIIGSRRRNTRDDFKAVEKAFFEIYQKGDWIVSGGCPKGGDRFAEVIAKRNGLPILIFYPKWYDENGILDREAGKKRNTLIAQYSDIIIACVAYDRKGGTEDTLRKFLKRTKREDLIIIIWM